MVLPVRLQRRALSFAVAVMVAAILGQVSGSGQTSPVTTSQAATRASDFNVFEKTIPELQAAMQTGTITARDLVERYRARIRAYDEAGPTLRAFIALNPHAVDDAAALDAERRTRGPRGPLHGIPVAIKDNYATVELPMTGGSKALAGFEPHRDAFLVQELRDAGAIIIGKTNLHELGYGITTISSMGGQTLNPYDPDRNTGGR